MKYFTLVCLLFITSCSSLKNDVNTDYIEFNHYNPIVIKSDRINLKFIPKSNINNKFVTVKIIYNGEYLDNKRIKKLEYEKIKELIYQIKEKELVMTRVLDGASNSIKISDNKVEKELKFRITKLRKSFQQMVLVKNTKLHFIRL